MARVGASIVAEVCRRIVAGELRPGDLLPSAKDIARELDVTASAAHHALARMRQDGLAEKAADGPGLVITERAPEIASAWEAPTWGRDAAPVDAQIVPLMVRTAIESADADGLEATSMRRIAGRLEVESATLRKYVRDRAHLEILMADAIFAEHPPPESPAGDWRAQLEALCLLQLQMYRGHLWLAKAVSFKQPLLSPHVVAHLEWAVRALSGERRLALTAANFVRGHAMRLAQEPALRELGEGEGGLDAALFDFGLQRLLDGFARLIPARGKK
ncbi:MAG TPA: GntR family transcriptional regulator [Dactylosporangium sp.]|nr:GntR family transcriptional regulator [Dactylosporangium sp.]